MTFSEAPTTNTDFLVNQQNGEEPQSSVAALADGGWIVAWQTYTGDGADGRHIWFERYDAKGNPVQASGEAIAGGSDSGEIVVASPYSGKFYDPMVVALPDGGWLIAWEQSEKIFAQRYDAIGNTVAADGSTVDGDSGVFELADGDSAIDDPSMVTLPDGGWLIIWEESDDILTRRFDADGNGGDTLQVDTTDGGDDDAPTVTVLADGGWLVAWTHDDVGGDSTVFARRYDADGDPAGEEFQVSFTGGYQNNPVVTALENGGWVVTWYGYRPGDDEEDHDYVVFARAYDKDGNPIVPEGNLNEGEVIAFGEAGTFGPDDDLDDAESPYAVGLPDGGWLILARFQDGTDYTYTLVAQRYDATGATVGDAFRITDTYEGRNGPGIDATLNADGDLLITWKTKALGTFDTDLVARVFEAPEIDADAPTFAENGTGPVATVTDPDGDIANVTFEITGGSDADKFVLDQTTGELRFKAAPDYENPTDTDGDNVYEVTVTADDGLLVSEETVSVTVTNVAGETITGTKKKDTLTGTGEEDILIGKKGKDKLNGEDGDDWLRGGKHKDKLCGGEGADSFVFDTKLKNKHADKIKDFEVGIDTIVLDSKIFKKVGGDGLLDAKYFDTGKKADSAKDRILYHEKSGWLRYDKDGKGGHDAVKVAKLDKDLDLSEDDFLIV